MLSKFIRCGYFDGLNLHFGSVILDVNRFKPGTRQRHKSAVCQAFMCMSRLFEMHTHECEHVPFCPLKAGIFGSVCGLERRPSWLFSFLYR